jgi:hypothetical protein
LAATITDVQLKNPQHCFKGKDIGPKNLGVDFTVTVNADGCYAIAVVVLDDDTTSGDDIVASNLANCELTCICLKRGQAQKFSINAGGDQPKPAPKPGHIQLDNLTGVWPKDDGILDNTLELYVTIDVYNCGFEECTPGGDCQRTLVTGRLKYTTPVVSYTNKSEPQDTEIVDGEGTDRFFEFVEKGASAAGSIPKVARSESAAPSDAYAALIVDQNRRLDRELTRFARRLGTLEQQQKTPLKHKSHDEDGE